MQTLRFLRSAAILVIGAAGVVALIIALSCAAFFLFGAATAVLCLLGMVGLTSFFATLLFGADRDEVEAEFCAPEGALPRRERAEP